MTVPPTLFLSGPSFRRTLSREGGRLEVEALERATLELLAGAGVDASRLRDLAGRDQVISGADEWSALYSALSPGGPMLVAARLGTRLVPTADGLASIALFEQVARTRLERATGSGEGKAVAERASAASPIARAEAFAAGQAAWGTRPLEWLGYLDGPRGVALADDVLAAARPDLGVRSAFLYTVAIGEGLNGFLNKNQRRTDRQIDGFLALGTDTFGSRYRDLRANGFLPADVQQGRDFQVYGAVNEDELPVKTAEFKNVRVGLKAVTAMLADEQHRFLAHAGRLFGAKRAAALTRDEVEFWTYVYFNSGSSRGRRLLERHGIEGARPWRGKEPANNEVSSRFNSAQRMAFVHVLDRLGIFESPSVR